MVSPASTRPLPLTSVVAPTALSTLRLRSTLVGVDVVDGVELMRAPVGVVAATTALLATAPAFTSAWVIV